METQQQTQVATGHLNKIFLPFLKCGKCVVQVKVKDCNCSLSSGGKRCKRKEQEHK